MTSGKAKGRRLTEFAEQKATARYTENAEIARTNRALRAAVEQKEQELDTLQKRLGLYEALDAVRLDPPTWLTRKPKGGEKHRGIPCALWTDPHWAEVVQPEQVDGVNAYNLAIGEQRMRRFFEKVVMLTHEYFHGVTYEGFTLFLGGDNFSGVIHDELRETNEETIMESIVSYIEPLEAGITVLREAFGRVHLEAVVGNHGRNTKKPRSKFRAQDNFDWLLYKLIERDYRGDKLVTIHVADAPDSSLAVYGTRYLLTHGDQFRGGSGISGALAPLLLGVHRKTKRQAAAGRPYDVMVMGHWHQSFFLPARGLIVGGTPKGYDEHAFVSNYDFEPAQQPLWVTTPEHGITMHAPVLLQDRQEEGW